jgi:hypothetical protein
MPVPAAFVNVIVPVQGVFGIGVSGVVVTTDDEAGRQGVVEGAQVATSESPKEDETRFATFTCSVSGKANPTGGKL